jgi:hypothetical protein
VRRRLFSFLTALSALVCVAVCAMWVRSYFVSDELSWSTEYVQFPNGPVWNVDTLTLRSSRGWWSERDYCTIPGTGGSAGTFKRRGVDWRRTARPLPITFWATRFGGEIPVPYWLTAVVFAVLPARRVTSRALGEMLRRRTLGTAGLCRRCGYDLRATPDRCPECGATGSRMTGTPHPLL